MQLGEFTANQDPSHRQQPGNQLQRRHDAVRRLKKDDRPGKRSHFRQTGFQGTFPRRQKPDKTCLLRTEGTDRQDRRQGRCAGHRDQPDACFPGGTDNRKTRIGNDRRSCIGHEGDGLPGLRRQNDFFAAILFVVLMQRDQARASDAEVVERLPGRASDPALRRVDSLRKQLAARPDDLALRVEIARRYFDLAMAQGDRWRAGWPSDIPVRAAFATPIFTRAPGGWLPRPDSAPTDLCRRHAA